MIYKFLYALAVIAAAQVGITRLAVCTLETLAASRGPHPRRALL